MVAGAQIVRTELQNACESSAAAVNPAAGANS
jgi:hypothetical protein